MGLVFPRICLISDFLLDWLVLVLRLYGWRVINSTRFGESLMKYLNVLVIALSLFSITNHAHARVLYAATAAGSTGELYVLDASTGAVIKDVGPLNDVAGANFPITGLAFHPTTHVLYGSTGNDSGSPGTFVSIDPFTALVTVIGPYNAGPVSGSGKPATMADLSFDTAGNLYGVGSVGGPQLYSIDIATGQATVIGSTGLTSTTGGGLAIDPSGVFYGTPTATRYGTYDSMTGAYTNIAAPLRPAGGGGYGALSFSGDTLYGLNIGPGSPPPTHLVTIDPTTGTVTDIGASLNSLDAIAFTIPEPTTCGLMLTPILVGLVFGRSKR